MLRSSFCWVLSGITALATGLPAPAPGYDFHAMLQPVPASAQFADPDYNIWCGTAVKWDDGKYHLFYSRWPRKVGHLGWVTHSEVAHATSDSPFGPWQHRDVALPPRGTNFWDGACTHNPTVLRIGQRLYLYYMGNYGDREVPASGLNWTHRNRQRIGVAVADSPNGPWQRFDRPVVDVSADTNAWDALLTSNPAVARRPDGGVLMVYKAVARHGKPPFGGPVSHLVATSDSPLGPFTKQPGQVFSAPGVAFAAEDPFIWRGTDRYWAVVKDNAGHFTGRGYSLALWESADGLAWKLSNHPLVTTPTLTWADGRTQKLDALERPQLLFEAGRPIALLCAAAEHKGRDGSFNVQIPLRVGPLKVRRATASSSAGDSTPDRAIDGRITDDSRWVSQAESPNWIELDLGSRQKLAGIHLYTGYRYTSPIKTFVVQFWSDGEWRNIPSATFGNNQSSALHIPFDDAVDVTTDKLRLWITGTHQEIARVLEIVVWPATVGNLPPLAAPPKTEPQAAATQPVPLIYLNQSGFNAGKPKRFTAPTLPDATPFEVRPATGGEAVFKGAIRGHIGDFTAFEPDDAREYVVAAGTNTSVPFRVGPWWLERVTYQQAVNFMIDSRHHVGNDRAVCQGSFGWRDDHHFGWQLHTLVPQYLSNPSAYDRMPRQINYEAPANPKLWGKLEPYRADAPDMVKLIHWGADVIVSQELKHELLKSQLAWFLYAWPWLKQWFPAQNYEVVRDFTFAHWSESRADRQYPYDESDDHNLLALKTRVGSTKGALPPGYSLQPNLLLYEVAKRDGRPDADQYFQAAFRQAEWMIANLDWNDPPTTKGQRMSEFITLTGLAQLLSEYPDRAPKGLVDKINAWAEVAIRRSTNLWDFRKLDDGERWTPMGDKPTMWNEPGNVAGFPAALLAAQPFLTNAAVKARLDQLVWSHFDNMFGRNPTGRHFSYDAPREIEGVEFGWYSFLPGGIGRLAEARFVIDGSPKDGHYPYHPEKGNIGWTEGWVQFNVAFNASLAYLARAETRIMLRREGKELVVRLEAPLNFDYGQAETGQVIVTTDRGDVEMVTVTEESANSRLLSGRVVIDTSSGATSAGDGKLQVSSSGKIEAGYGFGYMRRAAALMW